MTPGFAAYVPGHLVPPYQEYIIILKGLESQTHDMYMMYTEKHKSLTVENFDEWLAIHQRFSYQSSSLNASPLTYKQFVKLLLVKVL